MTNTSDSATQNFSPLETIGSLDELVNQAESENRCQFPEPPHDGWGLDGFGVTQIVKGKDPSKDSEEKEVCGPCWVEALNRDTASNSWGLLIRWLDPDRVEHHRAVSLDKLVGDNTLAKELMRDGLRIRQAHAGLFLLYLHDYVKYFENKPTARYRCVQSVGWSDDTELVYVTPHSVLTLQEAKCENE